MEKSKRRLILGAAPIIFLLVFLLIYIDLYGKTTAHLWIQTETALETRVIINETVEEKESLNLLFARLVRGEEQEKLEKTGFACHSSEFSLLCMTSQPVRIDTTGGNITVHIPSYQTVNEEEETVVKPYGRQENNFLEHIKPVKILHGKNDNNSPTCKFNHKVPAVIFSSAYVGNTFHEFSDLIIPLFLTTKHLKSQFVIILDDYNQSFVTKFKPVLTRLTDYEIINPASNTSVHCFPGSIIGLTYHDVLSLNPSKVPGECTMDDFKKFLKETFELKFTHISQIQKPKLMLLSRKKTRRFINENEMVGMIKELGFRVIIARDELVANMSKFSKILNSCSVLVGAHGAGLTNELFLPSGGVTVQLELLGLEFAASYCFGNPAPAMNVHYVPYRMAVEESTLVELYGRDHSVIVNPGSVYAKGYKAVQEVYLDQQNLKVNLVRFKDTLIRALQLVTNSSSPDPTKPHLYV